MAEEDQSKLKTLNEELAQLQNQFEDVIQAEEKAAELDFQTKLSIFKQCQAKLALLEDEKSTAQNRWNGSHKESQNFLKQMQGVKNKINKIRKKLELLELPPDEVSEKGFIIFKKDHFDEEEAEVDESEETEEKDE